MLRCQRYRSVSSVVPRTSRSAAALPRGALPCSSHSLAHVREVRCAHSRSVRLAYRKKSCGAKRYSLSFLRYASLSFFCPGAWGAERPTGLSGASLRSGRFAAAAHPSDPLRVARLTPRSLSSSKLQAYAEDTAAHRPTTPATLISSPPSRSCAAATTALRVAHFVRSAPRRRLCPLLADCLFYAASAAV
jgi:hypothetical protein